MKTTQSDGKEIPGSHRKIASYLAAASATFIQTTGTHPTDTVAKRLQIHPDKATFSINDIARSFARFYPMIYPTHHSSIWDGYTAALTYRVTASTMTYGSQPLIQRFLEKEYGHKISQWTGITYQSTVTHMLSGALFGALEVTFLPLDRWKILRQTGDKTAFLALMKQEKQHAYKGSMVTCLRNMTAFPALYGVSDLTSKGLASYHTQSSTISLYDRLIASSAGAVAAAIISNPTDVIKTNMQKQSLEKPLSAIKTATKIYAEQGLSGFGRGLWPRIGAIVPRLTFLKTLSEELVPIIHDALDNHGPSPRK